MQIDFSRSTVSGRGIEGLQDLIHSSGTKLGLSTRAVPMEAMTDIVNDVFTLVLKRLRKSKPDYIVLEIADGIFQRETRMLLDAGVVRESVDHVFFAAGDSLAAESGARILTKSYGLPLRATSGALAQSELSVREAEEVTGLPCLALERILDESIPELLKDDTATPMVDSETDGMVFTPEPAVSEA